MKKNSWLLLLLACTLHFVSFAQLGTPKYSAAAVKTDLEYLYKTLQASHYNLYAYVSKATYDKAYQDMHKSIKQDSLSLLEVTKLFQKFSAIGNVGHSEVDFPATSYIAYAQNGGTVFPLELAFENDTAYVRKNFSGNKGVKPGDEVLSINNVPVKQLRDQIHPYLSAERPYFKDVKLEFWSFPRLYWSVFGTQNFFSIKTKSKNGQTAKHTLKPITVMDFETQRGGEILNSERNFTYYQDVAYVNPGAFSSPEADGEASFKAFIDSAFADINSKQARALVVDLRNNAGGHNTYSDHLIAYFADKPFRWYSKFTVRTSEVLKEQTKRNAPKGEMDDYTKAILNHKNGETFVYDQPMQQPMPEGKRYSGKVYVLVNRQTYSMAAVSAALIQDYNFAEIVGEETGDIPTLYASQFSFPLPQTGITVKVPKGYIIRPSGDETLEGVMPDHKVKDHLLDENDEILQYTLTRLLNVGGVGE